MLALNISPAEVKSGQMTVEHREAAVHAVMTEGFVLLKDVVDLDHIALLRTKLLSDLEEILTDGDISPYNFNRGNVQQDPPPFPPYLFRDVLVNDMVIEVTEGVLGPGIKNSFYSGNTALPGDHTQAVHVDTGHLWPDQERATPPFGLVVNIPVVDTEPRNGSIQLWPGTHLNPLVAMGRDSKVPEEALARQRQIAPPIQPVMPCGSVLIRDIRLWHNGMPNWTDQARPMIAMIHWIHWWNNQSPIPFAREAEPFLQHPRLKTNAVFSETPIDYIHRNAQLRQQRRQAPMMSSAS